MLYADIKHMVDLLFNSESKRMDKWLTRINKANSEILGITDPKTLFYRGVVYATKEHRDARISLKMPLDDRLIPEMDNFIADLDKSKEDKQQIFQVMYLILSQCQTMQEFRDALPENIFINFGRSIGISHLNREKEELFTILHNQRAMRSYNNVKDKIEFYCATAFIS